MARKLLIAIALVIAAFPYLGFTHSIDTIVSTVLSLFMAAVLLFSKRPKTYPEERKEPLPDAKPSPFVPAMHELPVTHPKDESFSPVIAMPKIVDEPLARSIPSPIKTPMRKRMRAPAASSLSEEQPSIRESSPLVRRPRKSATRVMLSEEADVPPADRPVSVTQGGDLDSEAHQ